MSYVKELPLWAFNSDERRVGCVLQAASGQLIDILVTHMPPYGILDHYGTPHTNQDGRVFPQGAHFGSRALRKFVNKAKPKLHVFGHIHEGHGLEIINDTTFVNAAILGGDYRVQHKPTVVDIFE